MLNYPKTYRQIITTTSRPECFFWKSISHIQRERLFLVLPKLFQQHTPRLCSKTVFSPTMLPKLRRDPEVFSLQGNVRVPCTVKQKPWPGPRLRYTSPLPSRFWENQTDFLKIKIQASSSNVKQIHMDCCIILKNHLNPVTSTE